MKLGLVTSSIPIAHLFFSPPLSPRINSEPTIVSCTWVKPSESNKSSIIPSLSSSVVPFGNLNLAENSSASRAVAVGNMRSSCCTYATLARIDLGSTKRSFMINSPLTIFFPPVKTLPDKQFNRLVFPLPDGPINAQQSPELTDPSNPFKITFSPMVYCTLLHLRLVCSGLLDCKNLNSGLKSSAPNASSQEDCILISASLGASALAKSSTTTTVCAG
mmetsp:Transcript_9261/g.15042  ORF Transcript_9261/g.15042 Transcript_9261/m.15042 type:complete len:218 (+) Transcript_9261:4065-4718(+)